MELKNHANQQRSGTLNVGFGAIRFSHPVTLEAGETRNITLDKSEYLELSLKQPRLWWPNGYGEQYLHDLSLRFQMKGGSLSDVNHSRIGIRKLTYNQDALALRDVSKLVDLGGKTDPGAPSPPLVISCNGQKIFLKGANWGMDEGMLRCDREGFEDRIRYEKDMNFTMILSNLGHVGKQDFFDECDRAGIFIWEEFGVNHDNMPYDVDMWLANARDRVLTKRNHACVALWCTANEGSSHEPILTAVPKLVDELDGTRLFLQHSTQHPPTDGDGPYEAYSPVFYMGGLAHGFRPEIGSPMVPAIESVRRMMPHNKLWPIGPMWGTHDWWQKGFETGDGTCGKTEKAVACYGAATGIEDFCRKAQMVSLETLKAIFEAWNDKLWDNCTGVIIWMSNPVWPDLYWNTYDYYMEPTAGYFGCKKGCEPIHIQWSMASNNVKVVNNTLKPLHGVYAEAHVHNLDGSLHLKKSVALDCTSNNVHTCFNLFADDDPKSARFSDVYFIRLELKDASGLTLSNNFYWNAKEVWKYKDLASMNNAEVRGTVKKALEGETCKFTVSVANTNKAVALMVRIKLMDPVTGLLVAPVIYSENYFSLIPGESRQIALECRAKKVAGKEVKVMVEGWNVTSKELPLA